MFVETTGREDVLVAGFRESWLYGVWDCAVSWGMGRCGGESVCVRSAEADWCVVW